MMDEFYKKYRFKEKDISLYQYMFKLFKTKINLREMEKWAFKGDCKKEALKETTKIKSSLLPKMKDMGVDPNLIDLMFIQYLLADHLEREMYKDKWVERVIHRSSGVDWFPSASYVFEKFLIKK